MNDLLMKRLIKTIPFFIDRLFTVAIKSASDLYFINAFSRQGDIGKVFITLLYSIIPFCLLLLIPPIS